MSKVLEEVIHESQTAYKPGRYVHDNLRSLELIKQYFKQEKIKGLLVGVDARKAFDSVDHEYPLQWFCPKNVLSRQFWDLFPLVPMQE